MKDPLKDKKTDFALHVMLIMKQDKVSKSAATFRAWIEGPTGFDARLGQGGLGLGDNEK